ncbi:hypothetical protein PIB30_105035, partial [Stylosanthes scabra]|nr:hypothetical protein [Stylosanthes scabra]
MSCSLGELPITYFGIPLGANPRKVKTWKAVVVRYRISCPSGNEPFIQSRETYDDKGSPQQPPNLLSEPFQDAKG